MAGRAEHQAVVGREDRAHAAVLRSPASLGAQHVNLGEVVARVGDQGGIRTDRVGEFREDTDDLAPLRILQLAQFVVDLHDLDRLDIEGLSGSRLVVDESVEFAFVGCGDGDHGPTVADRDLRIGIDDPGPLGRGQDGLQALGGLPLAFADRAPDLLQGRRGVVTDVAEAIDDRIDAPDDLGERGHAVRAVPERRIAILTVEDERNDTAEGRQRPMQRNDLLDVEERSLDAQFGDDLVDVGVFASGKVVLHVEEQAHLVGQSQPALDFARRGGELLGGDPLTGRAHGTKGCDLLAEPVETYFLLEGSRIYHCRKINFSSSAGSTRSGIPPCCGTGSVQGNAPTPLHAGSVAAARPPLTAPASGSRARPGRPLWQPCAAPWPSSSRDHGRRARNARSGPDNSSDRQAAPRGCCRP